MSTSKKSEAAGAARRTEVTSASARARQGLAVPRAWLIAISSLLVVPWLIAGGLYIRSNPSTAAPSAQSVTTVPTAPSAAGPWGKLTVTPIVVSPPLEYVAADWGRIDAPDAWYFPGTPSDVVDLFLASTGLSSGQIARLRSTARPDPRNQGLVITPDPELVRTLDPQVRARIYVQLAKSSLNFDQANSFRFLGASPDAWLGGSLISPRTRALVESMIYTDGGFLHFADVEAIRSEIRESEELQRLAKTLLRQATVLVRLFVEDASEIDALSDYWGRGGRRVDLRPLLESVAGGGPDRSVDIVHLLPTFARHHLYRYPKLSTADLTKPVLANCLWTALNFFRAEPDDRFLDVQVSLDSLKHDYYIVEHGFQLGDIVAFLDEEGDLFHVAVYLADDLVFTKNGTSPMAPWSIMTIGQLNGFYYRRAENPRLIYHRRNDL